MNVAVFGSRTLGDFTPVDEMILALPTDDSVLLLVDGKLGVSNYAKNKASFQMIPIRTYPANFKVYGESADWRRNHRIIDDADVVYVFCNKLDYTLRDIIDYAKENGKTLFVTELPGELYTDF